MVLGAIQTESQNVSPAVKALLTAKGKVVFGHPHQYLGAHLWHTGNEGKYQQPSLQIY